MDQSSSNTVDVQGKVSGGARIKTTFSSDRDGNKAALRVLVINLIGGKILSNATNSIPERAPTMLMSWPATSTCWTYQGRQKQSMQNLEELARDKGT